MMIGLQGSIGGDKRKRVHCHGDNQYQTRSSTVAGLGILLSEVICTNHTQWCAMMLLAHTQFKGKHSFGTVALMRTPGSNMSEPDKSCYWTFTKLFRLFLVSMSIAQKTLSYLQKFGQNFVFSLHNSCLIPAALQKRIWTKTGFTKPDVRQTMDICKLLWPSCQCSLACQPCIGSRFCL